MGDVGAPTTGAHGDEPGSAGAGLTLRRRGEHRRMPWRNGGGITHEIAVASDRAGGEFDWRISIAEVAASGPFSAYPGVDRTIMLLAGQSMVLTVDGRRCALRLREPFAFRGESVVGSEVLGPTRDLNVMTRRERTASSTEVVEPVTDCEIAGGDPLILVCLTGSLDVATPYGEQVELDEYDAALWWSAQPITLGPAGAAPGAVAIIRIRGNAVGCGEAR